MLGSCAATSCGRNCDRNFFSCGCGCTDNFLESCESVAIATIFDVSGRNSQPQHHDENNTIFKD